MDQSGFVTKNNGRLSRFFTWKFNELSCYTQPASYIEISSAIDADQWDIFLTQLQASKHTCVKLSFEQVTPRMIKKLIEKTTVCMVYRSAVPLLHETISVTKPHMQSMIDHQKQCEEWTAHDWQVNLDQLYNLHISPLMIYVRRIKYENEQDYNALKKSISFMTTFFCERLTGLQQYFAYDSEFTRRQVQLSNPILQAWRQLFDKQDSSVLRKSFSKISRESYLYGQGRKRVFQCVEDILGLAVLDKKLDLAGVEIWEVLLILQSISEHLELSLEAQATLAFDEYKDQVRALYLSLFPESL